MAAAVSETTGEKCRMGSGSWIERDAARLIHAMHDRHRTEEAVVWVGGRGVMLVDERGREYFDGLSGLWNVLIGHGREELAEAAASQVRELAFASTFAGSTHVRAIELAERLASICYRNINRFFFAASGSEAVEAAIKTARYYHRRRGRPEKNIVVCLTRSYHGTTLGAMSATGCPQYSAMFGAGAPGFVHIDWGEDDAAALLEAAIDRLGANRVAAFLAEPVPAAGGCLVPPEHYWPRVREICDRHEVLLIADEVVTAFGRTGRWFALSHWNTAPDMVAFAKGITSGYFPLSGVGFSEEIAAAIEAADGSQRWNHASTNSAHPVGCAVALANLDIIEREGLIARSAASGKRLRWRLALLENHPHVGRVRSLGMLAAVELVQEKSTGRPFPAEAAIGARVHAAALGRGLFSRTRGDIFHLAPPLVAAESQIDQMVDILREAIHDVLGVG